ncbi:hypothetical protein [Coleofasciculus sp. E2-BRE-01]|uniref:hypothetical protein n=1 Tax=Coleofasciculus sp. E2-BRE-01 TaxID=3069524 RepID=UPI003301C99D
MASIKITSLNMTGSDLFIDSESYLNELTDEDMNKTKGGIIITFAILAASYYYGYQQGC